MAKTFLFPGQGSQKVGMGADFYEKFDSARARIDEANEILGRDVKKICFEGPAEELTATQNTQPALFTIESAICDILKDKNIAPSLTLGHSLGEYSALYAAGVYSFADGLKIVAKRGELMAQVGSVAPGTMAAIIGVADEVLAETLDAVTSGVVVAANLNSPGQTVISGDVAAVEEAGEKLKEAGAKRVIMLPVSGAFHSPLMQQAAEQFEEFIAPFAFNQAQCAVICNVTAQPQRDGQELKKLLVRQLMSPVRWVDSMTACKQQGAVDCIEVGPGNVLKGLARKCDPEMNVAACDTVDNLYSLANS